MSISLILKKRRRELGLTLKEVAGKVGVSEPTVQRWESGNIKNLRQDKIVKLAMALKITPSELMGWSSEGKAEGELTKEDKVDFDISVGKRFKQVRRAKKMTQRQFATAIRTTEEYISDLEKGKAGPSDILIFFTHVIFNVSEAWLRTGEGSMLPPIPHYRDSREMEVLHDMQLGEYRLLCYLFRYAYPLHISSMISDLFTDEAEDFVWLLNLLIREWADGSKKDKMDILLRVGEMIPEQTRRSNPQMGFPNNYK